MVGHVPLSGRKITSLSLSSLGIETLKIARERLSITAAAPPFTSPLREVKRRSPNVTEKCANLI
jgi:hypothetical protein